MVGVGGISIDGSGTSKVYDVEGKGSPVSVCREAALEGMGMSEANNVAGRALLRAWKCSILIRGRRMRRVEWCGAGGNLSSAKVWSGVFGSSQPSRPVGAKFRGSVIDMSGLRSAKEQKLRSTISKQSGGPVSSVFRLYLGARSSSELFGRRRLLVSRALFTSGCRWLSCVAMVASRVGNWNRRCRVGASYT